MIKEPNAAIETHPFEALQVRFDGAVLHITLNRPDRLNAFDEAMKAEFAWLTRRIESNADIRVIVIGGAGERAFCAGADVGWFEQDWQTNRFRTEYRWIHDVFDMFERIEIPVIAAIRGICACGGLELAMACDFRIAAEDARFGFTESNINLIPGSGGCSRLIKMVGPGWAKELVLAGEFIDAARALQIGLVTRVVAADKLMDEAGALAAKLAAKPPLAVGMAKAIMNACADIDQHSGRILERIGQSVLIKTEDHAEGVRAFREKRKARYSGN